MVQRRLVAVAVTSLGLVAGALTTGSSAAAADAVTAQPICYPWQDQNTFGVMCEGWSSGTEVRAVGRCKNGQNAYGPWVAADTFYGSWSYAYCSAKGGLADGWEQFR